eukprot:gene33329-40316_t
MAGVGDESNWSKRWQPDEDDRLREAIKKFGEQNWQNVAEFVGTRNLYPCQQRWTLVLKPGIIKGHWSEEEDRTLVYLVSLGLKSWPKIAEGIPGRTSKQCRERWTNCLDPTIKTIPFTEEEDAELLRLQSEIGNKWAEIARSLPGRTENHVKNRFKTLSRQSQLQNIDEQEGNPPSKKRRDN